MTKKIYLAFLFITLLEIPSYALAWLEDEETYDTGTGTTYTKQGSTVYSNTGVMYTVSGGLVSGSDGSSYQISGNAVYKDGEPVCYIRDNQIFCDE